MGIQGLETYLLKHLHGTCPRVTVKKLVLKYREETGRPAVTLVDTNILIRQCLKDLDLIAGGQFQEYQRNLRDYVERLEALGISPVFFLDGSVDAGKMRCWLERKAESHRRTELIYRHVHEGRAGCPVPVESCVLPAGIYECTILTLKQSGFPVFCAVAESDLEMVRYARENRCFAILSRDTDFVIMEGAKFYLSLFYKHVKMSEKDMSTFLFDRAAVARRLGLRPEHLPLLAALLHSDYVDGSYLTPLYSKLLGRRNEALSPAEHYTMEELVPSLVKFVQQEVWFREDPVGTILDRTFNGYPPFLLRNLAKRMGLEDQFSMKERLRQQLQTSLRMHDYVPPRASRPQSGPSPPPEPEPDPGVDPEVLEVARARHRSVAFLNSAVLSLLTQRLIQMGPALEDPGLPAANTAEAALRPFRRRVYGLLQVPGPFTEWVVPSRAPAPGQQHEPAVVEPISPDPAVHPHPGLLALWHGHDHEDDDAHLAADRWRLFAWALAAHRPPSARVDALAGVLRDLPKHLVVPAAIAYLLYHSGALRGLPLAAADLVRLLTRTCLAARLLSLEQLAGLGVARYDRLEVHTAALFMRAFSYVSMLNDVLGAPVPLEQLHPALYFNGKLFHNIFMDEPLDAATYASLDPNVEELIISTALEETEEIYTEE